MQPEATSIRVSDAGGTLKSTVKKKPARTDGTRIYFVYLEVSFSLRRNLFYEQSTSIRISYGLTGAPRSSRSGRNASWYIAHQLVEEVGIEKMRTILDLIANDRIAYRGAGEPETVTTATDWRRLLDLVEEVGGSTTAEALFRDLALMTLQTAQLDERVGARDAYHDLIAPGDDWLPPLYVREPMNGWLFQNAQSAIGNANEVLDLRARVETAAASAGVTNGLSRRRTSRPRMVSTRRKPKARPI